MGTKIEVSTAIDRYNRTGEREIDARDEVILWDVNEQGERTNARTITVDRFLSDEFKGCGSRLERLAAVNDSDWLTNEDRPIETKPSLRPSRLSLWDAMFAKDACDFYAKQSGPAFMKPVSPSAERGTIEGVMEYFGIRSSL